MSNAPTCAEKILVKDGVGGLKPSSGETSTRPDGARAQIARAAALVLFAFIISNIIGLGQQLVMSQFFGTSEALDSYNAANRLTELLFNLVAGGALGSAFIPMFTGMLTRKDLKGSWKLASGVINVVTIALVVVALLFWVFAPWVVQNVIYILKT